MKFMGSKQKISKELSPIIQEFITEGTIGYAEAFVGGANMFDKIEAKIKIGYDLNHYLISLLNYIQNLDNKLPETISEEEYKKVKENKSKYPEWYVGLVGFCASYGARWFEGYARSFKKDGTTPRDMPNEAIRNIQKQRYSLKGIFECRNYKTLSSEDLRGYVIYCDPPYKGTKNYRNKDFSEIFDYDNFYKWCIEMNKYNTVLISEYDMPDSDFECIWSKEHKTLLNSLKKEKDSSNKRVEKLFIVRTKS